MSSTTFLPIPLSAQVWVVQEVVFHLVGAIFEWCDRTGTLQRFKVRKSDHQSYTRLLPRVLFNQVCVLLPCMMMSEKFGLCFHSNSTSSIIRFLISLPVLAVGHDIIQYLTHNYLLHQPIVPLMRILRHSIHHSTKASSGISACYMSAPDFFLEIVLPFLVPLALVGGGGADLRLQGLVAGLGAVGGVYEHCGYDFALYLRTPGANALENWPRMRRILADFLDNRSHGEHHYRGNVSFSDGFGSPGVCDTLFGTRWDLAAKRRAAEREWKVQRMRDGWIQE